MDIGWLWLLPAATIVWMLGAYNRMVRLRGRVLLAFAVVDRCLAPFLQLVDETLVGRAAAPVESALLALHGARLQLDNNLRVARQRTIDAPSMAALRAAVDTLQVWWERWTDPTAPHAAAVPDSYRVAWAENTRVVADATRLFNAAVTVHNAAVRQFPAVLLARLFGFRAAGSL